MTGGSVALAGLLGAGTGLGLVLVLLGLRRQASAPADRRWRQAAARARAQATAPRIGGTLAAAAAVITRWPAGTILAGLAAWFLPPALGPTGPETSRCGVSRAPSRGPSSCATPWPPQPAGAGDPGHRAARARRGPRSGHRPGRPHPPRAAAPGALRAFAAEAADLVAAALLLAAEQQSRDLGQLLSSLADSARQHAAMRLRVAAACARVRTASRIPLRGDRAAWRGHRERLHPADARPGRPACCGSSR